MAVHVFFLTSLETKQVSGWVENKIFLFLATCQKTEMCGHSCFSGTDEGLVWFEARVLRLSGHFVDYEFRWGLE